MKRETEKVSHTPGPWRQWRDMDPNEALQICAMETDFICAISGENTNAQANARLIAAAPELLAACKSVRDNWDRNLSESMSLINAAIFKATGGAA